MPACARKEIVHEGEIGVYHVWTRCVRRSYLCGYDPLTRQDYQHRRQWIRDYLPHICQLFAIDAGFHVEMQNHLHLLLRARPDVAETWTDRLFGNVVGQARQLVDSAARAGRRSYRGRSLCADAFG